MNGLSRRSDNSLFSLFDDFFSPLNFVSNERVFNPAIDITENEKSYEIVAEVPGMTENDITVSVDEDVMCIKGEKKFEEEKKEQNFHRIERRYGAFERRIRLPRGTNLEKIEADYDNGLLKISIPKEEVKTQKIEIKSKK